LGNWTTNLESNIQKTKCKWTKKTFWFLKIRKFNINQFQIDFNSTQIIVTEPIFNFTYTQECLEECIFEEYAFDSLIRTNGTTLLNILYWILF
jgi:actin-related protein